MESKNRQKFFPVETVIAAGEVKSNVDKGQFKDALLRLAEVKEMRSAITNQMTTVVRRYRLEKANYNPNKISFDQVFTFLICNSIDFSLSGDTISSTLNEIYKPVDYAHRHSVVLSLEDGLFFYMDPDVKSCAFPISTTGKENNQNFWIHSPDNKYTHFKYFCSELFFHTVHSTVGFVSLQGYVNFLQDKVNHWIERPMPNE